MILSDVSLIGLQLANQQLQEGGFANTVWPNDCYSTAQIDSEFGLDEQVWLTRKVECDVWRFKKK